MENEHLKKGALVFQGFLSLFPAYAGVIPGGAEFSLGEATFPRIRGGDPAPRYSRPHRFRFSPHTRG